MFKPLLPVVCDVWSHEFNEIEHVSKVHAKYGANHLQKDLSNESSENKNQSSLKSEDQVAFHVFENEIVLDFNLTLNGPNFFLLPYTKLYAVFLSKHIPPPKFS